MSRPRPLLRAVLLVAAVRAAVGTASAHGVEAGGPPVGIGVVVAVTVCLAVLAGLAAARSATNIGAAGRLTALVGPVLIVLGGTAAVTAADEAVLLAGGCLVAGVTVTWALLRRVGRGHVHETCANATLGAVTAHRAVEGVALVAAYATGSAVGLLGVLVVAGHATAETAAVGCLFGVSSRSRGAAAVGVVQVGFLAGAAAGLLATSGLPPVLGVAMLALVGGVLLGVGVVETVRHVPVPGRVPDRS